MGILLTVEGVSGNFQGASPGRDSLRLSLISLYVWVSWGYFSGGLGTISGGFSPQGESPLGACSWAGRRASHHELEEEPGMLQDSLAHGTAADHPLQGQLLVKQLGAGAGITESRGAHPVPPSGGRDRGGCSWRAWD